MAIIILTFVYLLSGIGAYFLIRKKYLKSGDWENLEPNLADLMVVITPIANTIIFIILGAFSILDKIAEKPSSSLLKKFFNLKNE